MQIDAMKFPPAVEHLIKTMMHEATLQAAEKAQELARELVLQNLATWWVKAKCEVSFTGEYEITVRIKLDERDIAATAGDKMALFRRLGF